MNCSSQSLIEASKCFDCIPRGMQSEVQTMLACEWANGAGCSDPVVVDWLQRIFDGGDPTPSAATIRAVCNFCTALRSAGIMDKMLVVNPIIPDSFLAMRYPLIYQVGNGNSPFINHNFVAADLNVNGLLGDSDTKYFDTGFVPSAQWASTDSAGLTLYESEATPDLSDDEYEIGCERTAISSALYLSTYNPGTGQAETRCWNAGSIMLVGLGDLPACYLSNRTSNVLFEIYHGTSGGFVFDAPNFVNQAGAAVTDISVYFMALNDGGAAFGFSGKRVSFMAIHEGLKQGGGFTEVQDFFNAVQNLRIALGGGFV